MDGLDATLRIVAGVLAVVASALPLYSSYKERKERKKKNDTSRDTDKPSKTGPSVDSGPEV
jgi:hypothetical protein